MSVLTSLSNLTFVDYSIKFVIWKPRFLLLYNEFNKCTTSEITP